MQRTSFKRSVTLAGSALMASLLMAAGGVQAQKMYDGYKPPKTEFGQPDLQGFWTNVSLTPVTRPRELGDRLVYTEEEAEKIEHRAEVEEEESNRPTDPDAPAEFRQELSVELRPEFAAAGGDVGGYNRFWLDPGNHVMRVAGEPRTSILTTKDGQYPPRKKDAPPFSFRRRPAGTGAYDGYEMRSLGERCIISFGRNAGPPMFANGFYNNNYQIVQTPETVMILVEMNHDARIIRLNSEHITDDIRPWFGDSIGKWEGNTLVVETTNMPQSLQLYGSWENLKVTERFTRVAKDRMHYKFTIEDPTIWEKPWGGEYEFSTLEGQIYEYACHEGNYALPGILKGGVEEEAKSAKK